jgi:acyl-CoA synthetase (AMP-forming)/AMP-acid ligase II
MTSLIRQAALREPQQIGIRDRRSAMTWREVETWLAAAVAVLRGLPLSEEGRVAILSENCVEVVLAHVAGLMAGRSTVPVNSHLRATEVAYQLETARTEVLLVGPDTLDAGLEAAKLAQVPHILAWRCPDRKGAEDWDAELAAAEAQTPSEDFAPRPPILFTSGTTGVPKAVELPHAMFPHTETLGEHLTQIQATDAQAKLGPHLVVGPLYHTGPLGACRLLAVGVPVVVLDRFDAERTLQAIEDHRIETTMMVPTHFQRLLALPEQTRTRYDMSSLRFAGHSGAPCPQDVKRRMIAWWGNTIFESYGATEVGGVARISAEEWLKYPGSVGRPRDRFEFLIVDDDGNPVPTGTEGKVYFIDKLGLGIEYKDDPEKTAAAHLRPGVFTLGEIGFVNEAGYLFLTDRAADLVISGGVNIYPAEAEKTLLQHHAVDDVACFGIPHADLGEALHALVVPKPGSTVTADGLIAFCQENLSRSKCPRSVELIASLNRNSMGKINKQSLRAPYWPKRKQAATAGADE